MSAVLLVLKIVLSMAFLAAGIAKLAKSKPLVEQFHDFHLPLEIMYFIGAVEIAGAVLLWVPMLTVWVLAALACLMLGAAKSHIGAKHGITKLLPALGLFGLCVWAAGLAHWLG